MKQFITVIILFLSFPGYSQTALKTQMSSYSSVDEYLWSFSKNKAIPNEKTMIDFTIMDNWRGLGYYLSVSDDGKYFAYTINKPNSRFRYSLMSLNSVDSLVIQSTSKPWRMAFATSNQGFFTADGKQYIYQNSSSLCLLQLGGTQLQKVEGVDNYKVSQNKWLAYQLKDKGNLILQNLATGKEKQFSGITDYDLDNGSEWLVCRNSNTKELLLYNLINGIVKKFAFVTNYKLTANGKALLLKATEETGKGNTTTLKYVKLSQGEEKTIWSTSKDKTSIGNYTLNGNGDKIVFSIVDSSDANNNAVWFFDAGIEKGILKITNHSLGIPQGLIISDAVSFTDNGHYIKLSLQAKSEIPEKPGADIAGLEVWNHKDLYLQSAQSGLLKQPTTYNAIVNIENGKVVLLENNVKKLSLLQGDFAIIKENDKEAFGDRFWENGNEDSCWLVSLKDGSTHLLNTRSKRLWFSPGGNYLVYFDAGKGCHYFSYDLHTGALKDISANVPENQLGITERSEGNDQKPKSGNLAAWIENDAGVLVYDNYDIWKLDLTGKQPALNITNGFGHTNNSIFNLFTTDRSSNEVPVINIKESLLLRAYNSRNKQSGFYRKANLNVGVPLELYMGGYFMNLIMSCHDPNLSNKGMAPIKAKNRDIWIVQRQSANDAPNYYETSDFKSFRRLTDFQPQKDYQWLTEELHSFKHLDGKPGQGILYKPEDFDPTKKYPVLIVFYGGFSDNMYQFPVPTGNYEAISPGTSPVWFLNNGYMVFTPDISVAPLRYGPKAYSVIEGAAQYLKTLPYVDGNKLGCASHSWSAQLGAYMFTHSKSIGATAISEGFSYADMINMALSPRNGKSRLEAVENERQSGNLWENKESWLDQTTVLSVDKATSPLLLFCNKESSEDYQDQTFQFFNALRRLNKNVWWLKYDKGDHTLSDPKELYDYTIRYTQFFDHYLKNAPAPMWMTEGIPLKLKGIESRYKLDPKGQCNDANGDPCPICEAWNKQYKRTPEMFTKPIAEWKLDKDIADELERKQNEKRKDLDKQGEIQTEQVMRMLNK